VRLAVGRGQSHDVDRKGRPERVSYSFSCRLDLEEPEAKLVETYVQSEHSIHFLGLDDVRDFRPKNESDRNLTVGRLIAGWSVTSHFVTDLTRTEASIRSGLDEFKVLLSLMENYGGQEFVEI